MSSTADSHGTNETMDDVRSDLARLVIKRRCMCWWIQSGLLQVDTRTALGLPGQGPCRCTALSQLCCCMQLPHSVWTTTYRLGLWCWTPPGHHIYKHIQNKLASKIRSREMSIDNFMYLIGRRAAVPFHSRRFVHRPVLVKLLLF